MQQDFGGAREGRQRPGQAGQFGVKEPARHRRRNGWRQRREQHDRRRQNAEVGHRPLDVGNGEGKHENADEQSRRGDRRAYRENERRRQDHQKTRQAVAPARRQARHRRPKHDHQRNAAALRPVRIGTDARIIGERHRQDRQHRQGDADREQIKVRRPHMVARTTEGDDDRERGGRQFEEMLDRLDGKRRPGQRERGPGDQREADEAYWRAERR